jgi:RNA polymerase sigma factor (sigma-70 family)
MADAQLRPVVRLIRRIVSPRPEADLSDRQLLERFTQTKDDASFTVLVERHGRLVMGVCRRALRNHHDSEDAFQATFLVLVRKAGSISKRESVGSWLHGVAYRIATRARSKNIFRRGREEQVERPPAPDLLDEVIRRDLRAVLDDEVSRLPTRCRVPFILCYMEGKTNEEAARLLGCPKGTVLSRLARAREILGGRLSRRGLTVSATLVTTMLSQSDLSASVRLPLIEATVKSAVAVLAPSASTGLVPVKVMTLVEGALRAMWLSRIIAAGAIVLGVCSFGSGLGVLAYVSTPQATPLAGDRIDPVGTVGSASPVHHAHEQDKPDIRPARGYRWLVSPQEGFGSISSFGFAGSGPSGIVVKQDQDASGGLSITLAHPVSKSKSGLPDFRPVAFDADSRRFEFVKQESASGGNIAMSHYTLDTKVLPAAKVKYMGVEILTPEGEGLLAREAFEQAKKEGLEVLPLAKLGEPYVFTVTAMDGRKLRSHDFRGKVVLIDCWATWCSPCVALLPELKTLYEKYHNDGLEIIGVSFDRSPAKAQKKIQELSLSWPQVYVPTDEKKRDLWQQAGGIGSLPKVMLVDRDGILRADNPENLDAEIKKLLSK